MEHTTRSGLQPENKMFVNCGTKLLYCLNPACALLVSERSRIMIVTRAEMRNVSDSHSLVQRFYLTIIFTTTNYLFQTLNQRLKHSYSKKMSDRALNSIKLHQN